MTPILIQACLNGSRTRAEHERAPLDAVEIAADARATVVAGARALHIHPRGPTAGETLAPVDNDAVVTAVREACPDIPLGLTTGAWIEPDLGRRLESIGGWRARPDYASVNFHEEGAADVAMLLLERGISVEAGLASVADAQALAASRLGSDCLRVLIEVEGSEPQAAVAAAAAIAEELDRLGIRIPQLHHGVGIATWAVLKEALACGHDVRIGLEDTLVLPDGRPAHDNAELVATAVTLITTRVSTRD